MSNSRTPELDYTNPDYQPIIDRRNEKIQWLVDLRSDPNGEETLLLLKNHYRLNPWEFVNDWGWTFEPRNIELGKIPKIPFILWPKQEEYLKWLYQQWRSGEGGLVEKSRDCGVTWLSVGFAVCMWCFEPGFTVGFGSRKEDLVDKRGDPKSIFEKVRLFVGELPRDLKPANYLDREHSAHMRIINPENGATITGEAGDQIGRGGRTSIYLVDEAAFIERQQVVDNALSQNTNCQIDISTPNGNGNLFYQKRMRFEGTGRVFVFDWRDDPRKDSKWYQRQRERLNEVTVAQEIDRDYNASQEDVFIPAKWVAAAIDAHIKLGFDPEGVRAAGFDPADVGDAKAVVCRHGSIITAAEQKTDGDITQAIPWAFEVADDNRSELLAVDGDGMGAPTMKLALQRKAATRMKVVYYHGSAGVLEPDLKIKKAKLKTKKLREGKLALSDITQKSNKDTFENFRAQSWSWVRDRFELTYEAVKAAEAGKLVNVDPENLISIDSRVTCLHQLQAELSRPKRVYSNNGKIKVESKKEMKARGVTSPNLGDATIMAFSLQNNIQQEAGKTRRSTPAPEIWQPSVRGVM